jgi:hypothetical protein
MVLVQKNLDSFAAAAVGSAAAPPSVINLITNGTIAEAGSDFLRMEQVLLALPEQNLISRTLITQIDQAGQELLGWQRDAQTALNACGVPIPESAGA